MERRGTAILLMLSLLAPLLMAAAAAVVVEGEVLLRETEWPWKCCDRLFCPGFFPPTCTCKDVVKNCDAACKYCTEKGSSGYVCMDMFIVPGHGGAPGPCDPARAGA